MSKKIERVFRKRHLTPEEIALDKEIRRKVAEEFPPAVRSTSVGSGNFSAALKDAIRASDKTMYQIAQDAGVSQIVVSRFMSGERDIRMATADKLAEVLGLKVASSN
jgi:DNA-binding phage protein